MTTIDDVAQTLAEYERLAIASGARVQIDPPEFTEDGSRWEPFWIGPEHPVAARATVYRDGIPTTVYAGWGESLPIDTAQTDDGRLWRDLWEQKPMQRFGSFVTRAALRRAFREVIGERVEPDEDAPKVAAPARDWDAEITAAADADAVHALHDDMKAARAVTPAREIALRDRLVAVTAAAWAPRERPEPTPTPRTATGAIRRAEAPPRAPQDYLAPTNRAGRRKKGGKR